MAFVNELRRSGSIRWLCLACLAFCLALGISWMIWASFDFAYEYLYTLINIDQHIAQFAPRNYAKSGFELTTEAERFRLFSEIVRAIHQQGTGLSSLAYFNAEGQLIQTLFTRDEVIHLQDVSILIDRLKWTLLACAILFFWLLMDLYKGRIPMPSLGTLVTYILTTLVFMIILVLLIGAHDVFYQLHVWVFPDEHKWFFYYEESLMSTMMKAPDLFAYIAVLLLVLAVALFILIMWLLRLIWVGRVQNHA